MVGRRWEALTKPGFEDSEASSAEFDRIMEAWKDASPLWSWHADSGQIRWEHPLAVLIVRVATPTSQIPHYQVISSKRLPALIQHAAARNPDTIAAEWFPTPDGPSHRLTYPALAILASTVRQCAGAPKEWLKTPSAAWWNRTETLDAVLTRAAFEKESPSDVGHWVQVAEALLQEGVVPSQQGVEAWQQAWDHIRSCNGALVVEMRDWVGTVHAQLKAACLEHRLEGSLTPTHSSGMRPRL